MGVKRLEVPSWREGTAQLYTAALVAVVPGDLARGRRADRPWCEIVGEECRGEPYDGTEADLKRAREKASKVRLQRRCGCEER